jgi:hypothetical protein
MDFPMFLGFHKQMFPYTNPYKPEINGKIWENVKIKEVSRGYICQTWLIQESPLSVGISRPTFEDTF